MAKRIQFNTAIDFKNLWNVSKTKSGKLTSGGIQIRKGGGREGVRQKKLIRGWREGVRQKKLIRGGLLFGTGE